MAVIGPWNSFCAQIEIPILNRAPGGPLALISPATPTPGPDPAAGVLRRTATGGEPEVYYPTGVRNFLRLFPGDDLQGAALAVLAKRLGLRRVYLLHETDELLEGAALRSLPSARPGSSASGWRGRRASTPARRRASTGSR